MKPRLFGIPATRSPAVAILRRGPSDWSQVLRWDPEAGTLERGSWIHANLYPQRRSIDLSDDRPAPADPPPIARRWIE